MDELITDYIEENYTQELGYELLKSLQLFDHFNYKDIFQRVINMLMDVHNRDKNEVNDTILLDIREGQDVIFSAHSLKINSSASIEDRNELLKALALLMRLEDYEPILTVLESLESDMEIFSSIICDVCMLDEVKLYGMVDDLDPVLLNTIRTYAQGKTVQEDMAELGRERATIVDTMKIYKELYGEDSIGVLMMSSGAFIGAPYKDYIPFIGKDLVDKTNVDKTAKNFLSSILISSNGHNAPIVTYKKYVDRFIDDIQSAQKLEPIILNMLAEIENYRRARNDQRRVPQISNR